MDFPKKQQQCLIPRYLLQYLTSLEYHHLDPAAPWGGGGGGSYTAGDGITISDEDVISIDNTVALKTDLSDYVTSTDLAAELLDYAELDDIPTKTSDLTNDSGYITSSALTGYATESWVTNQGYSTFSGNYNDLTNKPNLATVATSGNYNDLTNKPNLNNYVTTNTNQDITGLKTIYDTSNGHSDIYFRAPLNDNNSNTMGFSAFDSNNRQIGGLQIMNRTLQFNSDESSTYYYGTFLTNFRNNSNALNTVTGFRVLPSDRYSGSYSINFVAPFGTQSDLYDIYKSNSNVNTVNLVAAITDGTNTVLANKLGVVDISSLVSGGGTAYTAGTGIDITNDVISIDNTVALKSEIPTVPTNVSSFTNDAGYITSSALTGYATETWVTNQGYLTSVSWSDILSKPTFATVATSGSYNDLSNKPTIPDAVSGTNDGTNWTSLTIGSDTYGLASGSTPSNMVTTDTAQDISGQKTFKDNIILDKDQIYYPNGIYLSRINNNYEKGIYAFKNRNYGTISSECCGSLLFEYISNITRAGKTGTFEYYNVLSNGEMQESQYATPSAVGFKIFRGTNYSTKYFLAPRPSFSDDWNSAYSQYDSYYIPMVISDGTTNYYANEQGIVTIPAGGSSYTAGTGIDITNDTISIDNTVVTTSDLATVATTGDYDDLSNKPTIPDAVSGTNDGTNWTSLTIGSDTYGIPSGGGSSGPTVTRYTGYASHPVTYAVPSSQTQHSYMYINIYSSELSGFLNYDNVNPGDILYINTTIGSFASNNVYYRYGNLFTVCVPPKPDSTYPATTSASSDFTNGNVSGSWACSTINRMTNTQQTIASNIVKKSDTTQDTANIFNIRVPLQFYSSRTITVTVNSITHIAF